MSGSIKVGGHTVFVHTGASGAGTLSVQGQNGNTLLTDDGTAVSLGNNVRLPASGGIKDSSGNNVLTESGGTVTLNNGTIDSGVVFPAGHVIQVKSVIRNTEWQGPNTINNEHTLFTTDTSQTTAHTNTTFKVEITPISNTSKLLVQYAINIGNAGSGVSFKLYRGNGTSPIYGSSGSRTPKSSGSAWTHDTNQAQQTCYTILDEPATDAQLTYYLTYVYFGDKPWFNTNTSRGGQEYDDVYTSTITIMEISG